MDFDRDGKLDFVSGSYDPGEVFLFRALGKGKFVHGVMLYDEKRVPLVHHPVEWLEHKRLLSDDNSSAEAVTAAEVASYGSFPMPFDYDDDGDLDMLIGSLRGEVFLREGVPVGKDAKKKGIKVALSAASVPIEADGARLKVHSHADPFATDWDGDGVWDLVVGAGDGSVGWYRNVGTKKAPRLGPRQELVAAKSDTDKAPRQVDAAGVPLPAARAQICVADLDGDGRGDLLVGDFAIGTAASKRTSYVWLFRRSGTITPR